MLLMKKVQEGRGHSQVRHKREQLARRGEEA
jgi:hypothetical protein